MSSTPQDRSARQAKISAAAPKESKVKLILGVIIAVVAIAGIGAAVWFATQNQAEDTDVVPTAALGPRDGIMLNATDPGEGVPRVDVYEDFQCIWCFRFHEILGTELNRMATDGEAKVVLHLKSFLDRGEADGNSLRSANAAACTADAGPEQFARMHDLVMNSHETAMQAGGWTDEEFGQFADQAGVTGEARTAFDQCVADRKYADYLKGVDEQSASDGVTGTPAYRINGEDFDLGQVLDQQTGATNPAAFTEAVQAAGQG
ncbi:MAG: thioredoxin domain-containing protein [Mobilicoccus sp.]|nr:thioredoxin domain-containing protein [Mobilicoccus sp.]